MVPLFFAIPVTTIHSTSAAQDKKADAPVVTLPKTREAKPNRYFCLKAGGNCTSVKWIIPSGLEQLDPEIPIKDAPLAVVLIGDSGVYVVQAYGALGDVASDIASCTVTIGTPPPPTPPTPPDPLTAALQAGYNLDKDSDRTHSLEFLQQVFTGMVALVPSWSDVKNNGQALAKIQSAVDAPGVGLNATQVQNLRKAIGAEFAAKFGTTANAPIALADLATEIGKIATALKGVK